MSDHELKDLYRTVLGDPLNDIARQQNAALASYEALSQRKALRQVLLAEYRCRAKRGCLLLHVWQTPTARFYYQPRYELSPEVTEATSVESARLKHTSDGHTKWLPRAGSFDELIHFQGKDLYCDHYRIVIPGERLAADVDGVTPGSRRRPILLSDDDTPKDWEPSSTDLAV